MRGMTNERNDKWEEWQKEMSDKGKGMTEVEEWQKEENDRRREMTEDLYRDGSVYAWKYIGRIV